MSQEPLKILVLDDDHLRHEAFTRAFPHAVHVWTVEEFQEAYAAGGWDLLYLDHDLNDFGVRSTAEGYGGRVELTGADVATWVARLPVDMHPKEVIIHSWNPGGALNMLNVLRDAGIRVTYRPFCGDVSKTSVVEEHHMEPVKHEYSDMPTDDDYGQ